MGEREKLADALAELLPNTASDHQHALMLTNAQCEMIVAALRAHAQRPLGRSAIRNKVMGVFMDHSPCLADDVPLDGFTEDLVDVIAALRAPEAADAGAVAWFTHVENADGVVWRLAKTGENTAKYQAVCRDCSAEDALAIVKAHNASPTEAGMRERAALDKVREIASLYFAPWGAAKGARWEDLTGDQPFNPEIAMSLIEDALAPTSTDGNTTTNTEGK